MRFLEGVAKELYSKYGKQISELTVLFPSKRAGVFFTHYLASICESTIFMPEIITMDQLLCDRSSLNKADSLTLLFKLYNIYKEETGSDETFDQFYSWGMMLISDFDDIDKYRIDPKQLYGNLESLKEIDSQFADFDQDKIELLKRFWRSSDLNSDSRFAKIWRALYPIYSRFKALLISEGLGYDGMIYREVAESLLLDMEKSYIVVGLNALNRCEQTVLDHIRDKGSVSFFWDYDNYYIEDLDQEAGFFLRDNIKRYPQTAPLYDTDNLKRKEPKKINSISVESNSGQAQIVSDFINKNLPPRISFDNCAVILCDESMLLPVLDALPSGISKVNVTMGYPIKTSPVFTFVKLLASLNRSSIKRDGVTHYYHKDLMAILEHSYTKLDPELNNDTVSGIVHDVIYNNQSYIPQYRFKSSGLISIIFSEIDGVESLLEYVKRILKMIYGILDSDSEKLADRDKIFIVDLFQSINRMESLLKENWDFAKKHLSVDLMFKLIKQHLLTVTSPIEGDPLEGIQFMGLLESRALDFENVVFVSANDSFIPGKLTNSSFIPYSLKTAFGLPSIEAQNSMFAYYFYRLLHRAKNISFVYNSSESGLSTGEKSRYIYQLDTELQQIKHKTVNFKLPTIDSRSIVVDKDEKVVEKLNGFCKNRSISPTALNSYIDCTLKFYLSKVLDLKSEEEISEKVDEAMFGSIFHKVAELIYQPYIGKVVSKEIVESILSDTALIDAMLKEGFEEEYFSQKSSLNNLTGKNTIIYELIRDNILQLLKVDLEIAPFQIISLEDQGIGKKVSYSSTVKLGDGREVNIYGLVDRVDLVDGKVRIIDYKTGAVGAILRTDLSFIDVESLFRAKSGRVKAALQTLFYSKIYADSSCDARDISPGIYQLQKMFEDKFEYLFRSKQFGSSSVLDSYGSVEELFNDKLKAVFEEMFNVDIPFVQTEDSKLCLFCDFKSMCGR